MKKRTDIDVIINNKRYTICGYESEEYLQKIANYINGKFSELREQDNYRMLDADMKAVLMQINIADDFFKVKKQLDDAEINSTSNGNEIFRLKSEIVALQNKLDEAEREKKLLRKENVEEQKKVVKLETELEAARGIEPVKVTAKKTKAETAAKSK